MRLRRFYKADLRDGARYEDGAGRVEAPEEEANLVSSEVIGTSMHMPVIDLDVPVRLEPSSTPGHFHLYVDVQMAAFQYDNLLRSMVSAGLVEPGYYEAWKQRGATFVRKPGVVKTLADRPRYQ